jgi:hypothetical protein
MLLQAMIPQLITRRYGDRADRRDFGCPESMDGAIVGQQMCFPRYQIGDPLWGYGWSRGRGDTLDMSECVAAITTSRS